METRPWPRKSLVLTAPLMYAAIPLGGYLLWGKSLVAFIVYAAIWAGVLTIGRYFVCRRCAHYGKDCPTGFGYAVRIFPKDTAREFSGRACMIDVLFIEAAFLAPPIIWILSFVNTIDSFSTTGHVLMVIYLALFLGFATAHEVNGCGRCVQGKCPASRASRERRKNARVPK